MFFEMPEEIDKAFEKCKEFVIEGELVSDDPEIIEAFNIWKKFMSEVQDGYM